MIHQCVNIVAMHQGLVELGNRGIVPGEIHVHEKTAVMMSNALVGIGKLDRQLIGAQLKRFMGIPIVVNPIIPVYGMVVRPLHLMNDPDWMQTMHNENQQRLAETAEPTPAESGNPAEQIAVNTPVMSSQFLAPTPQTVTDILLKAATDCDNVRCVAVITVRGEKNVSVATNFPLYELVGVLQGVLARISCG